MASFIVSYDLRKHGRDYQALYSRLEEWKAIRILESVWLIKWNTTASKIRDDLKEKIDSNDALFVAKLTGEAAWQGKLLSSNDAVKAQLKN
ncbi:CRISPR-associated protein Cas2 [Paenochrobactrum glaciei]|uniref:Uncharacterized protein n=1 Tax=Paenochrobactrum glaciei TaxID=486407 RepID=A0ABP3RME0_9HYPH